MIQLHDTKPCSDNIDFVQSDGFINQLFFSIEHFETIMSHINFNVFSIGDPKVLICKRSDCLILIQSDGSFNISQVSSKKELLRIIDEIQKNSTLPTLQKII